MDNNNSNVLVNDGELYVGQYVTIKDFDSKDVVTHSPSAKIAYNEAKDLGIEDPVIIYVPTVDDIKFRRY